MSGETEESLIVRLRGVPFSAGEETIMIFLHDCNLSKEKKVVHFSYAADGRPSGEVFVELSSETDVEAAVKHNHDHIGSRYIEVFKSSLNEMRWALSRTNTDECTIRLRGVPFDVDKQNLIDFFEGLEIAPNGIQLLVDIQGRATGEAFVHFTTPDMTEKAKAKHMQKIGHRYIEIFKSSATEATNAVQRQLQTNIGLKASGDNDNESSKALVQAAAAVLSAVAFSAAGSDQSQTNNSAAPSEPLSSAAPAQDSTATEEYDYSYNNTGENTGDYYGSYDNYNQDYNYNYGDTTGYDSTNYSTDYYNYGDYSGYGESSGYDSSYYYNYYGQQQPAPGADRGWSQPHRPGPYARAPSQPQYGTNQQQPRQGQWYPEQQAAAGYYGGTSTDGYAQQGGNYYGYGYGYGYNGTQPAAPAYPNPPVPVTTSYPPVEDPNPHQQLGGRSMAQAILEAAAAGALCSQDSRDGKPYGHRERQAPQITWESTTGHSVHMRGLPYSATEGDVRDFLGHLSPVVVQLQYNKTGRPSGEADADFLTHEEAKEAMKRDRNRIGARYIEMFLCSSPFSTKNKPELNNQSTPADAETTQQEGTTENG